MINNRFTWGLALAILMGASVAHAQTVTFCDKGSICWIDRSEGKAKTEIRILTDGAPIVRILDPGVTRLDLKELLKESTSSWLCIQARHVYPDGKKSSWYISDTEGVCKPMTHVFPPVVVPPVVPPPVEPPPVEPPPIIVPPPVEPPPVGNVKVFKNVTNNKLSLTFEYSMADCPNDIKKSVVRDRKTKTKKVTITCLK